MSVENIVVKLYENQGKQRSTELFKENRHLKDIERKIIIHL